MIDRAVRALIRIGCRHVPTSHLAWVTNHLAQRLASELPDEEAITTLLHLDQKLYKLESRTAVRYGGGLHPKHRLTKYHQFFLDRVKTGERVLDIGCGVGELTRKLADGTGADVVGIDIDADSIAQANRDRAHPRVKYVLGDIHEMTPEGPFDVVVLSNVLEHLRDRSMLLERVRKAVRPSRLLIRVPLFERDWRVPLKKELGVEWRLDPTHETEYTVESFAAELSGAGLQAVEQQVRWGEIWAVAQ